MQALVHFAVGIAGGLLLFSVLDRPVRREFLFVFASGFWAMVPDFHWVLRWVGLDRVAAVWKAGHASPFANVFWFHQLLDNSETGRNNLEAGVALAGLVLAVGVYYWTNDWTE
jgi:hypothetical protein